MATNQPDDFTRGEASIHEFNSVPDPREITSIHAGSCELAFEQLVLLVKQSPGGRELARTDIKSLLYFLVDVVIQFGVERHERFIREIWYEPERRRAALGVKG
jgi:type IV secretion system protein VirB11